MKTNLITIAATLTMLLALGGCDFSSDKSSNESQTVCPGPKYTMDLYLFHQPVEYASDNTLDTPPANIQNLVTGLDIDIRNSAYLILQKVKDDMTYTYGDSEDEKTLYFATSNIICPVFNDAGVANAMAKDYNECCESLGIERLNQGGRTQCSEQWGKTWKSQVEDRILGSTTLQNSLYEWVKPELLRVVKGLDSNQRTYMKNSLNHMITYTSNYNHQAEQKFYRDCCNSAYGKDLFIHTGKIVDMEPVDDVITNPYRFLETWVYRRVEEGSMTAPQINEWLRRIKRDMGL